jgi:hypothetical protein
MLREVSGSRGIERQGEASVQADLRQAIRQRASRRAEIDVRVVDKLASL